MNSKTLSNNIQTGFEQLTIWTCEVHEGEICVLIGPSGCGKTTSMRMINRLISITSGEILINGQPNNELPVEELRRQIGYAIQQIGLLPHMTVADNVAIVPKLLHWDKDRIQRRVDELLDLVGLDPDITRDKFPSSAIRWSAATRWRCTCARSRSLPLC